MKMNMRVLPDSFQKDGCPFYICIEEIQWIFNAAVHMAFSSKMYDRIYSMVTASLLNKICIANVSFDKEISRIVFNRGKVV